MYSYIVYIYLTVTHHATAKAIGLHQLLKYSIGTHQYMTSWGIDCMIISLRIHHPIHLVMDSYQHM